MYFPLQKSKFFQVKYVEWPLNDVVIMTKVYE